MVKVKICGIKDERLAPFINKLHPDYVGFILSKGFKRSVTAEVAAKIRRAVDKNVFTVGVFVNEPAVRVAEIVEAGIADLVQLHGDEDEGYIEELKGLCNATVIKSAAVRRGEVAPYPENCDYLLLDAYSPEARGGTGVKVEWRRYYEIKKPFFLAGGITADNVREAVRAVNPFGVDSSGGLETDGIKDAEKIKKYIENARSV